MMAILCEHTKQEVLDVLEYHYTIESNISDRLTPRMRELSQAIQVIRSLSASSQDTPPPAQEATVQRTVSGLAMGALKAAHERGETICIPSLGIEIPPAQEATSDVLLPCPFCGATEPIVHIYEATYDSFVPYCDGCKFTNDTWFSTKEEAAAAWNRRAPVQEATLPQAKWQNAFIEEIKVLVEAASESGLQASDELVSWLNEQLGSQS